MNKKKGIAVAVVLLLILLIGGMLAYFTDTDTKDNVFTLGDKIDIELTETAWDTTDTTGDTGVPDAAEDIHPGTTLPKNPVIVNKNDSAQAYVFAEIIVPCYDDGYTGTGTATVDSPLFSLDNIPTSWNLMETKPIDTTNKTITYIYNYGTASAMTPLAKGTSTPNVFESITLDSSLTAAEAATAPANPMVKVNAYAIQTDGYDETAPEDIFALYTAQNP
jgi:predicted ribosomally synthesized peptide with SipW-like signal peptide